MIFIQKVWLIYIEHNQLAYNFCDDGKNNREIAWQTEVFLYFCDYISLRTTREKRGLFFLHGFVPSKGYTGYLDGLSQYDSVPGFLR